MEVEPLVVHGGPGESQWPLAAEYAPWEEHFILVQSDQRGASRTFARHGETTPDLTLHRIARDDNELVEYLCKELGKKTIIVLGHSWGSIVAVRMVSTRPELFSAYVGTANNTSYSVPFILIQGQNDIITPTSAAVSYFEIIEAPSKKLVLISNAGHFAFPTHSREFLDALRKEVSAARSRTSNREHTEHTMNQARSAVRAAQRALREAMDVAWIATYVRSVTGA